MKRQRYTFSVRPVFRVSKAASRDVGAVIVELAERGAYSPRALVEAARSPSSPAHRHFEWNNAKAGAAWRLDQAQLYQRAIVYEVVIERPRTKPTAVKMRCAYPVRGADGAERYVSGGAVVESKDFMTQLAARAVDNLISWRDQYESLRELSRLTGVFKEIDRLAPKKRGKAA